MINIETLTLAKKYTDENPFNGVVKLNNLDNTLSNIFESSLYENYDTNFLTYGMTRSGTLGRLPSYYHTEIQIEPGDSFIISGYDHSNLPLFLIKDLSGKIVYIYPEIASNEITGHNEVLYDSTIDGTLYINKMYTTYPVSIKKKTNKISLKGISDKWKNNMYGKTVYFDGDDICCGAGEGDEHQISYSQTIAEENNMSYINTAINGTTITKQSGLSNSILERVQSFTNEVDYIVIEGLYNDVILQLPLGVLSDEYGSSFDENTVIGALESLCYSLIINHFESKKLFILGSRCLELGNTLDQYWDAAISVFEKWGIPYLDMRKECNLIGINSDILNNYYYSETNTVNGLKPTTLSYKLFWKPIIESKMNLL